MSEKTTLLPTAPSDFGPSTPQQQAAAGTSNPQQPEQLGLPMPTIVIAPGLEFDPTRKYRYGSHALLAAVLIFISYIMVEMRNCKAGPLIDIDQLQALHISLMVFAFVLYLLSLFGIADFVFKYKIFFLVGALAVYVVAALMVWMTYEAITNPCVKTFAKVPVDINFDNGNVFSRGDIVGILVLVLDVFATLFMFSAATNFYRRY